MVRADPEGYILSNRSIITVALEYKMLRWYVSELHFRSFQAGL